MRRLWDELTRRSFVSQLRRTRFGIGVAPAGSARGHQDPVRALWEELQEIEPDARMN